MDGLVVFTMRASQDVDAAPGGNPGDRHTDAEVRPVRPQPSDEAANNENPEVCGEVVSTEVIGRPDVDVRIGQPGKLPDTHTALPTSATAS